MSNPGGSGTPSFEADIRPLFRELDRESMMETFDLWAFEDVRDNAEDILTVLESGTMPCDEPWAKDRIETFRSWVEAGSPP
ncbi:MAG TPA: hypothetical protein VF129_08775 [Actinomycetota bacterium]